MSIDLLEKCRSDFISSEYNLENSHILVAVSGGVDSMVLLHIFNSLKYDLNITLTCAHINHNLRSDSIEDQFLVESTCQEYGIPLLSCALNPSEIEQGESIEEWGRNNRYSFLKQSLKEINANYIVTAHHANDQAETLLMHLSEGAGPLGLGGIAKKSGNIVRPFLHATKNMIYEYATKHHIIFREDLTNLNLNHPRNYIRSEVLKPMETGFPKTIEQFQSSADLFSKYNQMLNFFIQTAIDELGLQIKDKITIIKKDYLKKYPLLAQSMIVKKISKNEDKSWRKHHWVELESFLKSNKTGAIHFFPNHYELLNDRETFKIRKRETYVKEEASISIGKTYENELFSILLKETGSMTLFPDSRNETIDAYSVAGKKLLVRPWTSSDYFQPLGMDGTQKVSDFLINRKIDRFEKEKQFVLTADGEIMWVCGKQISHKARIKPTTKKAVNLIFNWKG